MVEQPQVLFVCVQNAGRSQIAAALLMRAAGDRVRVRSAGSSPAQDVHPNVVRVMGELGIDLTEERPKILESRAVEESDVVVTMGCGDACPVFPGKRYLDWTSEDPAGKDLETTRRIRDDIARRVEALVDELDSARLT